jgi:hypothetical protein
VNSGVAQGSLISPILYCWYVNDLVEALSKRFGAGHTFAYADDIAVLCLGYSEVREAIHITETWASANKAQMNKKKCGLLRITKRETSIGKKEIEGVPFVKEYKYLGVPLDQAFTLKHLVQLVKRRLKSFNSRINLLPRSVIGTRVKLNLWSCYARCHFEYFAPAMLLCGQLKKFSSMYTKSLKRTLDLPTPTPNEPMLRAIGVPSLTQIAAFHIKKNLSQIEKRFQEGPTSVDMLTREFGSHAREYSALRLSKTVTHIAGNNFLIDLLANRDCLDRCYLGLVAGHLLTFRQRGNVPGEKCTIDKCPRCAVPATQEHFLNQCPINAAPRVVLLSAVPENFKVSHLLDGDFHTFYKEIRSLALSIGGEFVEEDPFPAEIFIKLAWTASSMARVFARNATELFASE